MRRREEVIVRGRVGDEGGRSGIPDCGAVDEGMEVVEGEGAGEGLLGVDILQIRRVYGGMDVFTVFLWRGTRFGYGVTV